ncbi:MAG TPA: ABC transporter permease [Anaerolineaceae bacterium]|nr:ABC transporter permease [Anaerolineaceae bacterium]
MKKIIAIAWKDARLRFSSKAEWIFFLILPIVFTVILAGGTGGPRDPRIQLDVVNQTKSPLAAELISVLEKSDTVRPVEKTSNQAQSDFSQRLVSAVLVIPPDFDLQHLAGGTLQVDLQQQPSDLNALVIFQTVQNDINQVSSAVDIANISLAEAERLKPFQNTAAQKAYFDASLQAAQNQIDNAPSRMIELQGATPNPSPYDPRANSSVGQLITWVFIPLLGISSMFAYERQKGTLRRILTTPTSKSTLLLGTILGQVATALVQMILLIGFGVLVLHVNWGQSIGALAVMLIAFALAAAALGTALGTFVKTDGQATGLSIMLGMVMALLGGCWYPIEMFPQFVRQVVEIFPTTWAMQAILDIVLRSKGLLFILPTAGILLGFAVIFFVFGIRRFQYE